MFDDLFSDVQIADLTLVWASVVLMSWTAVVMLLWLNVPRKRKPKSIWGKPKHHVAGQRKPIHFKDEGPVFSPSMHWLDVEPHVPGAAESLARGNALAKDRLHNRVPGVGGARSSHAPGYPPATDHYVGHECEAQARARKPVVHNPELRAAVKAELFKAGYGRDPYGQRADWIRPPTRSGDD